MTHKFTEGVATSHRVLVKVWPLPVRITHWMSMLSIVALTISGMIIANGNMGWLQGHADNMNWTRTLHVAFGWLFAISTIGRIIWMFIGNEYSRWDQFIPVTKERRQDLIEAIKFYSFLRPMPQSEAGHNPMAGLAYLVIYVLFIVQSVTGAALVSLDRPDSWLNGAAGWVFSIISIPGTRLLHHAIMWVTLVFVIQHLYSMSLVDVAERSGVVSSMWAGTKILPVPNESAEEVAEQKS